MDNQHIWRWGSWEALHEAALMGPQKRRMSPVVKLIDFAFKEDPTETMTDIP